MLKIRHQQGVSCSSCKVAELCLGARINSEEIKALENVITHIAIYHKNEHIYYANDKADYLFAVHSGYCKEYTIDTYGNEYINNFYFPGDLLGIEAFSTGTQRASAIAIDETILCMIPIKKLRSVLSETKELPLRLLKSFCRKSNANASIRMSTNARQRVASFLLSIANQFQERGHSLNRLPLPMSQLDASNRIGLAFETMNRILHNLENEDVIEIEGKNIAIKNIQKLHELCANGA